MVSPPARGLPPRIYLPIVTVAGIAFIAVLAYFLRIGLGVTGSALGPSVREQGDARIAATAVPGTAGAARTLQTLEPGAQVIPQSGTGPHSVGGGPPPAVRAALGTYRARLEKNPRDFAALVGLANLYFDAGKFAAAAPLYERALAVDPRDPSTRTDYATALHASGKDVQGLAQVELVIRSRPNFAPALYSEGTILQALGRPAAAAAALRKFIQLAPDDPRAGDARAALHALGGT